MLSQKLANTYQVVLKLRQIFNLWEKPTTLIQLTREGFSNVSFHGEDRLSNVIRKQCMGCKQHHTFKLHML